ncbi:hypothetical protein [Actinopolymorpha rutila]|uniref:Uncharacterized protein n=1 Tax=Actinopolymorpha rutila TaxID=446787 RepID=A0A852ZW38_9ACTN|nr:hypothetical protein [Actinopolymorpha rutila]NYH92916.1 hypothetical protein [Actinopolymorpha rutila]
MTVAVDPWGSQEPPLIAEEDLPALPERIDRLAKLDTPVRLTDLGEDPESWESPSARDLPEVELLRQDGWVLAPEESFLAFLPAVWPTEHRGWVRNRVPSVWLCTYPGPPAVAPLTEKDRWRDAESREDYPFHLEGTGIPVPSRLGRIWLLRSPVEGASVEQLVQRVVERAHQRARQDGEADPWDGKPYFVEAAREVLAEDPAR